MMKLSRTALLLALGLVSVSAFQTQGSTSSRRSSSLRRTATTTTTTRLNVMSAEPPVKKAVSKDNDDDDDFTFPPPLSSVDRLKRAATFWSTALPIVASYYGLISKIKLREVLGEDLSMEDLESMWDAQHRDGAAKLAATVTDLKGNGQLLRDHGHWQSSTPSSDPLLAAKLAATVTNLKGFYIKEMLLD